MQGEWEVHFLWLIVRLLIESPNLYTLKYYYYVKLKVTDTYSVSTNRSNVGMKTSQKLYLSYAETTHLQGLLYSLSLVHVCETESNRYVFCFNKQKRCTYENITKIIFIVCRDYSFAGTLVQSPTCTCTTLISYDRFFTPYMYVLCTTTQPSSTVT